MSRMHLFAVLFCLLPAAAQTPAGDYAGSRVCASCHPGQFARQSKTAHANALYAAAHHPLAASFLPEGELRRGASFHYRFTLNGDQFRVKAYDDKNVMDIAIEWAFGAGTQAVTFVTRASEDWYLEHFFSYYSATRSLAPSPGHQSIQPRNLPEAMGVMYQAFDPEHGIVGCFECHSTGPVVRSGEKDIRPAEPGVRCEACHGPGRAHVEQGRQRQILNPNRLSPAELNQFCGKCHRPPAGENRRIDWDFSWNVRHQPVYFSQSPCFRKSGNRFSCLTCHDPHNPMRRGDAAYYRERCLSCHGKQARAISSQCSGGIKGDCAACHMPKVSPQPGLVFHNHWIGIYARGQSLKPVR